MELKWWIFHYPYDPCMVYLPTLLGAPWFAFGLVCLIAGDLQSEDRMGHPPFGESILGGSSQ